MPPIISVEHLSKRYILGEIGTGELGRDLNRWWAHIRKLPDPEAKIGHTGISSENGRSILALDDVSFTVEPGLVLGIIGRNGAGKSTLLKILSRVTSPTSGRATIYGRIGSLLEVGTGFHPDLTGRENVYLNGAILGMKRKEVQHKFDEIVEFSGVEKFIDTPVKRYSSGMYVRLAFAVAAHLEPEILIVDEVLAVGDAEFQKKCLGKMDEVTHEGRTVLFVSHNMGSIRQLCTNSMLLRNGKIVSFGPTSTVLDDYMSSTESESSGKLSWKPQEMPGDEDVKMRSIALSDRKGQVRAEFGTSEAIYVEIDFQLLNSMHFITSINLFTSDGTFVCHSSEVDSPGSVDAIRSPGEYIVKCEIPANLLNVGTYSIAVNGEKDRIRGNFPHWLLPALTFTVISSGGPTSIFPKRKRPGVIAPEFNWVQKRLKNNSE